MSVDTRIHRSFPSVCLLIISNAGVYYKLSDKINLKFVIVSQMANQLVQVLDLNQTQIWEVSDYDRRTSDYKGKQDTFDNQLLKEISTITIFGLYSKNLLSKCKFKCNNIAESKWELIVSNLEFQFYCKLDEEKCWELFSRSQNF